MSHEQVIHSFYNAFANADPNAMIACYHDDVVFEDPAFGKLEADKAKAMWKMLIGRSGGQLKVKHQDVEVEGDKGSAYWIANYAYGPKKRKVENHVKAHFIFKNGKIWRHTDHFDVYKWSKMALGLPGYLLGWSGFMKSKIQQGANDSLDKYMEKNNL